MVINTNISAQSGARLLAESSNMLSKSLARLSSGSKIVSPEDDAAGMAVYHHQHLIPQAILFADEALRLALPFLEDGSLEPIGMQQLKDFRAQLGPATGSVT